METQIRTPKELGPPPTPRSRANGGQHGQEPTVHMGSGTGSTALPQPQDANLVLSASTHRMPFWKRIPVGRKMLFLLALPILGMIFFAVSGISILGSLNQLQGDRMTLNEMIVQVAAKNLYVTLINERGHSNAFLNSGGASGGAELRQNRAETDKRLATFQETVKGEASRGLRESMRDVIALSVQSLNTLAGLRTQVDSLSLKPEDAVKSYITVTNTVLAIPDRAVELTPNENVYADDVAYGSLLHLVQIAGRQRAAGLTALGHKELTPRMAAQIEDLIREEETQLDHFRIYAGEKLDEKMAKLLTGPEVTRADKMRQTLLAWNPDHSFGGITDDSWVEVLTRKSEVVLALADDLEVGVFARVNTDVRDAYEMLILAGALSVALLLLALIPTILMARGMSRGLGSALGTMEAIGNGDFSRTIDVRTGDELGRLFGQINDTARQLSDAEAVTSRIMGLVDNAPLNIMMADRDLNLTYINPASLNTFKKLEQYLPCRADELAGKSIDIFHKNPAFQRGILSNPANLPRQANIRLGPETLDLMAAAITDKEGNYIGPMVAWSVITDKVALDAQMTRTQNLVENAPLNMMMTDKDLNLIYLNPASLETFKKLEQYLPCRTEELVGKNIDIFHKNPAYQRGILSNPKNLPRRAQIRLGPETLDLNAAAIMDKQGNYVGPMVSWSVITDKVALDAQMTRTQNLVENAPLNMMMTDKDLNLIYLNPASLETFKKLEQYLPCRAEELVGKNIDIFHKNPAYQRGILSNPKNLPRRAQIRLGPETLDLNAAAIMDKQGNYVGPMVSWSVITDKVALDAQMTRTQNLVDNAPINMMMCDRDLNLIYLNPASVTTFKKLEQYLPCRATEMVGKNIDIFHKNPAYQRGILSNPANLPHHAEIALGPEWLDLHAAAIMSKSGEYIGPMVSWSLITDLKRARERDAQVRDQVTQIAKELGDSSTGLVGMANGMAANAEENSSQANNVSSAAEQVSANVRSVAAAVEEMSSTIQEVSKTVIQSSQVTRRAVDKSHKAGEIIAQLGENSAQISEVTKVIANIAQQTNILALNATIEAARAGDAGKGFVVVANEVKELANSTAKMTADISKRIAGIQQSTKDAVESIEEINRTMGEVDSLSSTVASAVEEQTATTNEIARSMGEAATGVNDIVRNITGVADAAKDNSKQALESKSASESLGQLATRLADIVKMFEKK